MVYAERTDKYISSKDSNNVKSSSTTPKSQPSTSGSASSNAWSKKASEQEKWKYNDMVSQHRDKFNNMHFS